MSEEKIKEEFIKNFPIENYGITVYKFLLNKHNRMNFSKDEIKFCYEIGLIESPDKRQNKMPETVKKELLEKYKSYGFEQIDEQVKAKIFNN